MLRSVLVYLLLPFCFISFYSTATTDKANSNKLKPATVILISIDGFAYKYLEKYKPDNLLKLAKNGVMSQGLLPIYPSKTFPNHLSMITGNYPINHGIVHNKFYNPQINEVYSLGAGKENSAWLTASPLWKVIEQQQVKTGVYFWPESEAVIDGVSPTYNKPYKKSTSNKERVDTIIHWLKMPENKRPEFVAGYFSIVDTAGHHYGPNSEEVAQAINEIDTLMGYFLKRLNTEVSHPVNIIIVSDHGMTDAGEENALAFRDIIPKNIQSIPGVSIINGQTQIYINFNKSVKEESRALIYKQLSNKNNNAYDVYQQKDYPKHWHFNKESSHSKTLPNIIPDIIIEVKPPYTIVNKGKKAITATHGYDPKNNSDLTAIFIASGPDFKKGIEIKPFENIHIFPLVLDLLSLNQSKNVDGKLSVLKQTLISK